MVLTAKPSGNIKPTVDGAVKPAPNAAAMAMPKRGKTAATTAAERGRAGARQWRGSASGPDAIRAKVRAEMKLEAAVAKKHAQVKIDVMEEKERKREEVMLEVHQRREEARAVFARAVAEEQVAAEQVAAEPAPHEAPSDTATLDVGEPTEPSHIERVQQLLRDRAERMRQDSSSIEELRQRVAARRRDSDRFGAGERLGAASRPAVVAADSEALHAALEPPPAPANRSLFTWAPPPSNPSHDGPSAVIGGPSRPKPGAQSSEAARKAWEWLNRPPVQP